MGPLVVAVASTSYLIGALVTVWAVAKIAQIEDRIEASK